MNGTSINRATKVIEAEGNKTKLDSIVQETLNNVIQGEETNGGTENIMMLLSNDTSAGDLNEQSQSRKRTSVTDEVLLPKCQTMALITSPSLGAQEFSATPISPRSTTTTSMSASGKH